ncbi:MAG: glycosyltransferase family 2 protein [Anaerolineales bacterium]|nr:glycosyltransferase family 2 protein [Anaerolineales bacterium]
MSAPLLSVIIPAYNEEKRLPRALAAIFNFLETQNFSFEVVVVENGSSDRTFEVAQKFSNTKANLLVLHEELKGKGIAVKRGALAAHGEYRFICDADLSMPIEEVLRFLPPQLNDFDVAIGSREAFGAVRYNEPPYRHWGGRVINFFIQTFILSGFHDTQCGFKCFRAATTQQLFEQQTLSGWSFDIELLYLARKQKLRIREVPIHWYFDAESKVSAVRDALKMIADIFRIHWNSLRGLYDFRSHP